MNTLIHTDGGDDHVEIIEALLTSPTRAEAAKKLGVSRSTLYRRLQDEEVRAAFRAARMDALTESTATLQIASFEAASALRELATDSTVNPHVRLGACRAILDLAYRAAEIEDVRAEIEQLKAELGVTT
jgi:AcrR family transcriptional regulator